MSTVEFVVFGVPPSVNARGTAKREWKENVATHARDQLAEEDKIIHVDLRGVLIYFHWGECQMDIDNIVKPTLDGATSIVFGDDEQFCEVTVRRTRLDAGVQFEAPTETLANALAKASAEDLDFVYLRISSEPVDHTRLP
jgi:hypothetical protein